MLNFFILFFFLFNIFTNYIECEEGDDNDNEKTANKCSTAIDLLIPHSVRETAEYRIKCFTSKENGLKCFAHVIKKLNFINGVSMCSKLGGRIIQVVNMEESKYIGEWVKATYYVNAMRKGDSQYFDYSIYPPPYANIGCRLDELSNKCMIIDSKTHLWCPNSCEELHSIVCEF
uniref:C-type lectin domain-containing protein n=1 Tax=Trichobilharzia regenti TaxID=157069 RepID=A0AA85IYP9_TRIRE|nr:unnamed protein product [Trichobilharzia regenti]